MPRIRLKADTYRNEDFRREIAGRLAYLGLKQHDLAQHLGVCDAVVSTMLKCPEKIQADRLRKIIAFLSLEPSAVLRFFGYQMKAIRAINGEVDQDV